LGAAVPLQKLLSGRSSSRSFGSGSVSLQQAADLLWAAQGRSHGAEGRTAPSAGALYPLEVYLVAGNVARLEPGVYRYRPAGHRLVRTAAGDRRVPLAGAALDQPWVEAAPAALVIVGVYERTTGKYGQRGIRYVHLEAGAAMENVYLAASATGLATVMVGAFRDREVVEALRLPHNAHPLAVLPFGLPP